MKSTKRWLALVLALVDHKSSLLMCDLIRRPGGRTLCTGLRYRCRSSRLQP